MNANALVKVNSTSAFYRFYVISRGVPRSWRHSFYIDKDSIQRTIDTEESVIDKDCGSYCEIFYIKRTQRLSLRFTFLKDVGENRVEGKTCDVSINYPVMAAFCQFQPDEPYQELSKKESGSGKLTIRDDKTLKQVLQNKVVRKKFRKAITQLVSNKKDTDTNLYSDSNYSFYFTKTINGERSYNGGLIFHRDYADCENLAKGKYSIHT